MSAQQQQPQPMLRASADSKLPVDPQRASMQSLGKVSAKPQEDVRNSQGQLSAAGSAGVRQSQGALSNKSQGVKSNSASFLKALQVRIESAIFESSEFRYFIVVTIDDDGNKATSDQKRRTDMSGKTASPIFQVNRFNFSLESQKSLEGLKIFFQAYRVREWQEHTQKKEEKTLLGECKVDLSQLETHLISFSSELKPIFQSLKFVNVPNFSQLSLQDQGRYNSSDIERTVGRFNVSFVLYTAQSLEQFPQGEKYGDLLVDSIRIENPSLPTQLQYQTVNYQPAEDPNFEWRVRIDIRAGLNMPLNSLRPSRMPTMYFEFGWSEAIFYESLLASSRICSLAVEESRYPNWNQQLLISNPPSCPESKGFIWVSLKDRDSPDFLERFYVPLTFFQAYKPVNLEIICRNSTVDQKTIFYMSLCLEKSQLESFVDSVSTVTVNWIDFDPLPFESKYFNCLLTSDKHLPQVIYQQVDLRDEQSLARAFQQANISKHLEFLSPVLKVPPEPIRNRYNSLTFFNLPKSYLDRKLQLFLIVNSESSVVGNNAMPSSPIGSTDILDLHLKHILQSTAHGKQVFPLRLDETNRNYRHFAATRIHLHLSCYPIEAIDEYQQEQYGLDKKGEKAAVRNEKPQGHFDFFDERDRWQMYSKQLQVKLEVLHRTMKEVKDKGEDLKGKGKEILGLRKNITSLKQDNLRLKQTMRTEELIELECQEKNREKLPVSQVPVSELKGKLLKLAQAYKADKIRNVEFEQQIRLAFKDIELIPQLQRELEELQNNHKAKSQQLLELQEETARENQYQKTIKKQEIMIAKLENLLERTVSRKDKVSQSQQEMETLKKDISALQKEVLQTTLNGQNGNLSEVDRLKKDTVNLQNLLQELQQELETRQSFLEENGKPEQKSSSQNLGDFEDWEDEKASMEIDIQRANARVAAISADIEKNEEKYSKEILQLRRDLEQKNALFDAQSVHTGDKIVV